MTIIKKQTLIDHFVKHFKVEDIDLFISKTKLIVNQSMIASQSLNESRRTQSEIFRQSIFEVVHN